MRSTTTVTVCACFAELTTPTRMRRRDRRHEWAGASWADPWADGARRSGRARLMAVPAAAFTAGFGAAAPVVFRDAVPFVTVFFSAAVVVLLFSAAGALATADFVTVFFSAAVVFFAAVFFSAIRRLSLSFVHHRQHAGNARPRGRQAAIVLQLARRQLEPEVEQLLLRVLELIRELGVRQPPHVLQLHCSHPPHPRGSGISS